MTLLQQKASFYQLSVWLVLIGVALVAALGIAESVVNIETGRIVMMTLLALFFGSLVVRAKLPTWLGFLSVTCLGIEYLLLTWANVGAAIGGAIGSLLGLSGGSFYGNLIEVNQSLQALVIRMGNWWLTLDNPSIIDPLIPQLFWGLAIWLASAFMAWSVWKHYQAMWAILPIGILLGIAAFFSQSLYNQMALYLLLAFVLQASSQGLKRQTGWENHQIDFAGALSQDLAMVVVPLSIAIVGVAFIIPSVSINEIAQNISNLFRWNNARTEAVASSFGLKTSSNPFTRAGLVGLPRSHLLGNSPELSQHVVMSIQTGELAPMPYIEEESIDAPRHYWQSAIYDRYITTGWRLSEADAAALEPETPLHAPFGPGREVRQVVKRGDSASDLLHTSGLPISVDLPVVVNYRANGDWAVATVDGDTYIATSWKVEPEPDDLYAAGQDYPPEIVRPYLQLPNDFPDRVRNLALDITATAPTPFDKALALEAYLRQFPYNLNVGKPPSGADVAEYFLFELREGYCDYYATSMTVMARAIGLPARFVIGYINGYYDVESAAYRVTEADAHSWVQIYFPEVGWVDFEPTGGRPEIDREDSLPGLGSFSRNLSGDTAAGSDALTRDEGLSFSLSELPEIHPLWWGILALIALFVIASIDYWRLRLMDPQRLSQTLYQRLITYARRIGLETHPGDTPYEFARKLVGHIDREITHSHLARFRVQEFWRVEIHPTDEPTYRGVRQLAQIFVRQQYAPPDRYRLDRDDLLIIWEELGPELSRAVRVIRMTHRYPGLFSRVNGKWKGIPEK